LAKLPNKPKAKALARYVPFKEATHQFVDVGPGLVSVFPFLLRLIPLDSPLLDHQLSVIENDLMSEHGLRSLSKKSPFYRAWNNENDKPYWRGNIWVNANWLAVRALRHYAGSKDERVAERSRQIAGRLSGALQRTIRNGYEKEGFIFENYDDLSGKGSGCHPFTGWSALVADLE
jgi:mannosyl-oligosaccharide glucosidase